MYRKYTYTCDGDGDGDDATFVFIWGSLRLFLGYDCYKNIQNTIHLAIGMALCVVCTLHMVIKLAFSQTILHK